MISFIICTNGKKVELTKLLIQSIFNTAGEDADIHLGGVVSEFSDLKEKIKLHDFSYEAQNGFVGKLRNRTMEQANGDILVYCDDDVIYDERLVECYFKAVKTETDCVWTTAKSTEHNANDLKLPMIFPKSVCLEYLNAVISS